MAQRQSGYARVAHETYVTPRWVYELLYSVEPWARDAWDCAPVDADFDFLGQSWNPIPICTNPPFNLAAEFCRHALFLNTPRVAMLLPVDFAAAKGRRDLFADNPSFKAMYIVTKRIRWENLVQRKAGPSQNHAWYVWDKDHQGRPEIGWLHFG